MAWTNSRIFQRYVNDSLCRVAPFNLSTDAFKVALYNNSITPDQNTTSANTAYNVGQWATASEVYQAGQWAQTGVALTSVQANIGTAGVFFWTAANAASGSSSSLTAYGCLVYDDTVASPVSKQGVCFSYFGGAVSSVVGTFTIVWDTQGIMRFTIS
jgi:hypothetical protein